MKISLAMYFITLMIPSIFVRGATGEISGKIVDRASEAPLSGVKVRLENVSYTSKAATDVEGHYLLKNIPIGFYRMKAICEGYHDYIVKNVAVNAHQMTKIDMQMETLAEISAGIEATAIEEALRRDITATISIITPDDITSLPLRGIQNQLAQESGIFIADGDIHIRGGQAHEVGYYIDGIAMLNPVTSRSSIVIIDEAIQEMQVIRGGCSADMGGAISGMVNRVMKTGGQKLSASIDWRQDGFTNPADGDQFLDTYTYGHKLGVITLGGPLITDRIRFFLAGEYLDMADRQRRWSQGFKFGTGDTLMSAGTEYVDILIDQNRENIYYGIDTVRITYPDGFTPKNDRTRYTLNGTVVLDLPVKIRLLGAYTNEQIGINDQPMLDILNDRYAYNEESSLILSGKATMSIGKNSYLNLKASHFETSLERGDSWFDHDWRKYHDSTAVYNYTNGEVVYMNAWAPQYFYNINGFYMERPGYPPMTRNNRNNNYYFIQNQSHNGLGADFMIQVGNQYKLKAGLDYRRWTCRFFDIWPGVMKYTAEVDKYAWETFGSEDSVPHYTWFNEGEVDAYGYDLHGNIIDDKKFYEQDLNEDGHPDQFYVDGPKHPVEFTAYIHNDIRLDDFFISAGLRMDYFDTDDRELKNLGDPSLYPMTGIICDTAWQDIDPFICISPRIGLSFIVNNRNLLYFNCGKFVQMPALNNIYSGTYTINRIIASRGSYYYDIKDIVGFGLEPIKSINFELGLRTQLNENMIINITGFFKRQYNLPRRKYQTIPPISYLPSPYNRLVSEGTITAKGLEFNLDLFRWHRLAGNLNYTYMLAEGTTEEGIRYPLSYLHQHSSTINLDYSFEDNDGGPIWEQSAINLLFNFSSGHPYTRIDEYISSIWNPYAAGINYLDDSRLYIRAEQIGASTTPWIITTDIRIEKSIDIGPVKSTVYLMVENIFNRKNVLNVYPVTGNAEDDGFISDPEYSADIILSSGGENYVKMYEAINITNGQSYWDVLNKQLWGYPRQLFFGIKFRF